MANQHLWPAQDGEGRLYCMFGDRQVMIMISMLISILQWHYRSRCSSRHAGTSKTGFSHTVPKYIPIMLCNLGIVWVWFG